MAASDRRLECGAGRSAGICPRGLIRLAIDGAGDRCSGRSWPNGSTGCNGGGTASAGVLETLPASIGPVRRVLTRVPGGRP
jgi:hypothetical protein